MLIMNRYAGLIALLFLIPSGKEVFPGKMEKAVQVQDVYLKFDSPDDYDVCKFRDEAQIAGKSYKLSGIRINKTMFLAVICDESEKDHFPKTQAVNLSEAFVLELVGFAYFCKQQKVDGGEDPGYYYHPDDELLNNALKDAKESKRKK
jgi:hypothetical protein